MENIFNQCIKFIALLHLSLGAKMGKGKNYFTRWFFHTKKSPNDIQTERKTKMFY